MYTQKSEAIVVHVTVNEMTTQAKESTARAVAGSVAAWFFSRFPPHPVAIVSAIREGIQAHLS